MIVENTSDSTNVIKHSGAYTEISEALTNLRTSLRGESSGEWGLSAETIISRQPNSALGLINGSIGVSAICSDDDADLKSYLGRMLLSKGPMISLFTGKAIGSSGTSFVELHSDTAVVDQLLTEDWREIGAFNGIAGLIATERLATEFGLVEKTHATEVIRCIESVIMTEAGPIDEIENRDLFAFSTGVTGIISLGLSDYSSSSFVDWSVRCIDEMLGRIEYVPEGAFVSDGDRLLPYVENGTAGVLLAISALPYSIWPLKWGSIVPEMVKAVLPYFTLNAGFGEGAAGLLFTASRMARLFNYRLSIDPVRHLVQDILGTRLYEVTGPSGEKMVHVMSEGQIAVSRDFWTGTSGVYVALRELTRYKNGAKLDYDLLHNIYGNRESVSSWISV